MKTISFKEYQQLLMDSFKKINEFFVSQNIKWWAHSGTLLGAVREGNLIEWDDDIDMTMTIYEWSNNKEKINDFLLSINWISYDRLSTPGIDVTRFFSKEIIRVEYEGEYYITKPFIDVMISIPVKNLTKVKSKVWSIHNQYNFIFSPRYRLIPYYGWFGKKIKRIPSILNLLVFIQKFLFYIFTFWVPLSMKRFLKNKNYFSKNVAMYYNYNNKCLIYNLDKINTKYKFGNTEIYVSDSWEDELNIWFGINQWKNLPPVYNRVPHHLLLTKVDGKNDFKYKIDPYIII